MPLMPFNSVGGYSTGRTGYNIILESGLVNALAGISASGGMTLAGSFQGSTATFTGLVSSSVGFSGAASQITATSTNSGSTFYPVFVDGAGNKVAYVDTTVGPLAYIPLTSTLKMTNLDLGNGALTMNSTQITATDYFYFISGNGMYLQDESLVQIGDLVAANEQTVLEVDSANNKVKISAILPTLLEVIGGISAAGGTFSGDIAASSIFATSAFYETANQIRVTNNARSWFL